MSAATDSGPGGRSRRDFLLAAFASAPLVAGGLVVAGRSLAAAQPSSQEDERILNFALGLEHLQAAFYEDAVSRGALDGELAEFARVVGDQERRHVEALRTRLGGAAIAEPDFDFGDTTAGEEAFREAAVTLEDNTVAAYIGQGANLTVEGVAAVAPLVSVEARHAAWIRDIATVNPAPAPADTAKSAEDVRSTLERAGLPLP